MTDAIDLSAAVLHNSPDIKGWPATTAVERLTMKPGQNNGLSFVFSANQSWPDYIPPGWTGPIQYTVWAGCLLDGVWHLAGFIQMWRSRPSTGAPILAQWGDWAYDRNRWGPMVDYQPKAGDPMVFLVTAGNARKGSAQAPEPDVTSVMERSNIVLVNMPANDDGVFTFSSEHPPVEPPLEPPIDPGTGLAAVLLKLDAVLMKVAALEGQVADLNAQFNLGFKGTTNGTIQLPPVFGGSRPFTITQTLGPVEGK